MAGFAQSVYGIGESSRAMWRAVQNTGLPCVLVNVRSGVHSNADPTAVGEFARDNPFRVNLMTFSFDYSRRFYRDKGPRFFAGRYNIGLWYWEQEHFPIRWHSSFDYYDEIWVPSEFTRGAIAAVSPIPVRKITYPFYLDETEAVPGRARFSLADNACVFLFTFDFFSTTDRKNPAAVIAAFRRAFRQDDAAILVIKSINWERERERRNSLGRQAEGAKVVFSDGHISTAEMNALFASADCYVSLHRSEGLGLGMAQAMYLGKPVIATNYSGNLEFMNSNNSLLVDYTMTELEEDSGPYERGTHWAEPDVEHAAELMRFIYENRAEAETIGARGAASVRATLDPALTSAQIARRVQELG
jgi:glycosyltransferase involved in cell wall biosynthesis